MSERKVDFFLVGAAKAGTTSLFRHLGGHDRVFLPHEKEPHFFGDKMPRMQKGKYISYKEYMSLFSDARPDQIIGEGSTGYLYSATAPAEIKAHNPAAKIIISLRNPIDRAYSLYWHHVRDFMESCSFEEALQLEPIRIAEKDAFGFHYLTSGLYYEQVRRYLDAFGKDRVLICLMEDIVRDPAGVMQRMWNFLELEPIEITQMKVHNISGRHKNRLVAYLFARPNPIRSVAKRVLPRRFADYRVRLVQRNLVKPEKMDPATRRRLEEFFAPDIARLSELIDRDLSDWIGGSQPDPKTAEGSAAEQPNHARFG